MRGLGAMVMFCLATGCIYLEEVNYPPEVTLTPVVDGPYYRGSMISLRADTHDRNASSDSQITLTWTLTDDSGRPLTDGDAGTCGSVVQGGCFEPLALGVVYRMTVTATDERGATGTDYRDFTVENRGPTAALTVTGRLSVSGHYMLHQEVTLSGLESTDSDSEDRCDLTYEYEVLNKPLGSAGFDPQADDCLTSVAPAGCTTAAPAGSCWSVIYRPDVPGTYQFRLTVTDPSGASATDEVAFEVDPDGLPCLAQLVPLPIEKIPVSRSDVTKRFSVNVNDELDPWPPTDTNAAGFPTFTWSLQTAADPLPVEIPDYRSNQYELDLSAFSAGEEILLRVDVADRVSSQCDDQWETCPPGAKPLLGDCVQRVTWTLEVY